MASSLKSLRWVAAGILVLAVISAAVAARIALRRAVTFENRAQRAEAVNTVLTAQAAALKARSDSFEARAARRDTIIVTLTRTIAAVDSANPVPDTCRPNLAVRDSLISEQRAQITDLRTALGAAQEARARLEQANRGLTDALASRPKLFSRFTGPNLGLGVSIGVDPIAIFQGKPLAARFNAGLTLNIGGIKL